MEYSSQNFVLKHRDAVLRERETKFETQIKKHDRETRLDLCMEYLALSSNSLVVNNSDGWGNSISENCLFL
jgi:hypothetical protein